MAQLKRLAVGLFLTLSCWAAPEPKALGIVYSVSGENLLDLEMHRPKFEQLHLQPPIHRDYLVIPGPRSAQRLHSPVFSVRYRLLGPGWNVNQFDPTDFHLYALRCEEARRLLVLSESTPIKTTTDPGLALKATPYGTSSLLLEPGEALPPGEYAILCGKNPQSCNAYCFAIDP